MGTVWEMSPNRSMLAECQRRSRSDVINDCVAILEGNNLDDDFLFVLVGPGARTVLEAHEGGPWGYWPKVWAAHGLLHVSDEGATSALIGATTDGSWRVREMAAKVIARHGVFPAIDAVVTLSDDANAMVRSAASRAFARIARD